MSPVVSFVVVLAANVLGAAMTLPQAYRLVRTRHVDGVSVPWAAMSIASNAWWVAYGIGIGSWAIVPVAGVSIAGYAVILVVLLSAGGRAVRAWPLPALAGLVGIVAAPAVAYALAGWSAAGVVLGLAYGVQLTPAVVAAYRSASVAGIAAGTWLMAGAEAVLWGVHGVGAADAGLVALAVTGTVLSTAVLLRLASAAPVVDVPAAPEGAGSAGQAIVSRISVA
jgi:uncharacterized protein with PQ loop repeat